MEPNFNGLNVSDPRYAAKYGNPYLRAPQSPQMAHFATLNRAYQNTSPTVRKNQNDYTGTMIGSNGKNGKNYILSPESDAKNDAMATHV